MINSTKQQTGIIARQVIPEQESYMSITLNAKGTSVPFFTIGKNGTTVYQGTSDPSGSYTIKSGDYWLNGSNNSFNIWTSGAWAAPAIGSLNFPTSPGSSGQLLSTNGAGILSWSSAGAGSVTSASIVSANGFAGLVATSTTTPAITLTTSVTGLIKGNGTALSAATSGTDYSDGTASLSTGILKSTTTTGALTIAIAADFPTLNQNTTGTAAGLSSTLAVSSGGTGATTSNTAFNHLVPSQVTNTGKFLTTDGTDTSWSNIGVASNVAGGAAGNIVYQSGSNTTSFVTTGTTSQVLISGTTPSWTNTPTLTGTNFTGIPNSALTNSSVTIGSTSVSLGSSSTTLAGLSSITSTGFTGALTGAASANILKAGDTMSGALILNADPSAALGAATKQYVDALSTGVSVHAACETGTGVALATCTYNNGTGGIGATLTANANGAIGTIGGYSGLVVGTRLLVKNQASQTQNGIYVVTDLGSAGTPWILTRSSDFDGSPTNEIMAGVLTYVSEGTLAGTQWVETAIGTGSPGDYIIPGTDNIVFSQFSGAGTYTAGAGISIASNVIANTGVTSAVAGTNIAVSSGTGAVTISVTGTVPTATLATNLAGGLTGALWYQSASNTSSQLAAGSNTQVLIGGSSPSWTGTPTISGANITGIPNTALTNNSLTLGSTSMALGSTTTTVAGLTSVTSAGFFGPHNGTVGSITPADGAFTTIEASGLITSTAIQGYRADNASGTYATWKYNGTANGDVGTGNQIISGAATTDFGITSRAGNLLLGSGSTTRAVISSTGLAVTGALSATGAVTAGDGTASNSFLISSGIGSGTNGGSSIYAKAGGAITIGIGNYSNILGGAYDATPTIYSVGSLKTYINGTGVVTTTSSTGLAVTGALSASGSLTASGGLTIPDTKITAFGSWTSIQENGFYDAAGNFLYNAIKTSGADDIWQYRFTAPATRIKQLGGNIYLQTAASGTAGTNITWNNTAQVSTTGLAVTGSLSSTGNASSTNFFVPNTGGVLGTPDGNNALYFTGTGTETLQIKVNNVTMATASSTGLAVTGALSSTGDYSSSSDVTLYSTNGGSGTRSGIQLLGSNTTMRFYTNSTLQATLDASGNLGLGVTPSAWRAGAKALQYGTLGSLHIQQGGANNLSFAAYEGSSNVFNYTTTGDLPARYAQVGGAHYWLSAPSGTAGAAITWTQAMTLDTSGNLLVGTATTSITNGGFRVVPANGGAGSTAIGVGHISGAASGDVYASFAYNGSTIGSITQNGTTGVLFNTSSDYRLKDITGPVTNSGAFIDALQPKVGTWKADGSPFCGFLAHEFQAVSPSSVTGTKDAADATGTPIYQSMQASSAEVIANLVAELQSERKRIATLEAQVAALIARVGI